MASTGVSQAPPENDFQIWNEVTLAFPVIKSVSDDKKSYDRLSILAFGTLRLGQNRLFPVDKRVGAGFEFKPNRHFSVTPTYLYRVSEAARGRQATEHRLRFEVAYEKSFGYFSLKDRPRIEYRIRNSRSDVVLFRNKLTLKVPIKKDGKELFSPFIADEPFYDFKSKRWNANEVSLGFSRKLTSALSAEFFYLLKNSSHTLPGTVHAVGTNLRIRID
ncbi:MAG TPA: DUF2490 domain-containing protein [Pyrinomonadaceae bacterium]|nr:DUF2490 domain-containing protein [Pyrinomonadaceae bacterium]